MNLKNGVILDKGSLVFPPLHATKNADDIDFSSLSKYVTHWEVFDHTAESEILSRVQNTDIIISNKVFLDEQVFIRAKNLKLICIAATGTNNVDLCAAKKHGIKVCNVTGYATNSVVQHVFSLILALHTNLCQYDTLVRDNKWSQSKHFCRLDFPITDLTEKTLGIIGYGELGRAVAKAADAFGLNVLIAQSLSGSIKPNRVELAQFFKKSDIISLHCPLTSATKNLINRDSLQQMGAHTILINTSRGGVINENDLLDALKNKTIAAAGLDVLGTEPPLNNPLIKSNLPNLIITPHVAWASRNSRQRLVDEVGLNISAFAAGRDRNLVIDFN